MDAAAIVKQHSADALAAYAEGGIDQVAGMLQSGSVSVFLSILNLQDCFGLSGDVAEIGVFQGKTFILMAHGLKDGERAFAIECFGKPPGRDAAMRAAFEANLMRFGCASSSVIVVADSLTLTADTLSQYLGGASVRLFSVDGDHAKDAVLHDLGLAAATLSAGGVVAADDLFNPWYPGVTEAFYEFCRLGRETGAHDLEPIAFVSPNGPVETGAGKLFFARRAYARRYKAGLKLLNQPDLKHCDPFGGFDDVPHFWFAGRPTRRRLDSTVKTLLDEILASLDR